MATAERSLRQGEWRVLAILGVPTFALALGITDSIAAAASVLAFVFAACFMACDR